MASGHELPGARPVGTVVQRLVTSSPTVLLCQRAVCVCPRKILTASRCKLVQVAERSNERRGDRLAGKRLGRFRTISYETPPPCFQSWLIIRHFRSYDLGAVRAGLIGGQKKHKGIRHLISDPLRVRGGEETPWCDVLDDNGHRAIFCRKQYRVSIGIRLRRVRRLVERLDRSAAVMSWTSIC